MPTPRLTIELVPSTCFCKNVRSQVDPARGDRIRMAVYAAAGSKCEICGGRGTAHPVEIKKTASPSPRDAGHFGVLKKLGLRVGRGAVICLATEGVPLDRTSVAIPAGWL